MNVRQTLDGRYPGGAFSMPNCIPKLAVVSCLLLAACGTSSSSSNGKGGGPPPDVSSVTPNKATLDGGGYVVLKGLGFHAGPSVTVAGAPAKNVTFVDKETLTFQVPSGRPGPADIIVINQDGGKGTFGNALTYTASTAPAPTLAHVTPNSGPSSGGTYAKLDGAGFAAGAVVLVAGAPAGSISLVNPALLTGQLPGHAGSGTGDVIVTNPDGQSAILFGGFAFSNTLTAPPPHVTAVAPSEGPLAGNNHAVIAVDKAGPGSLLFVGGIPVGFEPAAGGLNAVMPPGARHGLVDIAVTNADGQSDLLAGGYNYFEAKLTIPPSLARVTPGRAPPAGGGTVVLQGEGFAPGAQVLFGSAPATSVVVADARTMTCVVPPGVAGGADVSVQNADGGITTFKSGFVYAASSAAAPTVIKSSPNTGPATGGTVAEIVGGNFQNGALVIIGGRPAGPATWDDSGTLVARYPANPSGGADITVTNPDGQSGSLHGGFSVAATTTALPPRVNAVTPGGGPLEGGLPVFVSGDAFLPGALVFIGGHKAASAPQGPGVVAATLPALATDGLAAVAVTNPDGQSDVLPDGFNYYISAPALSAITPACGPAAGGTSVLVTGRSFRTGVSASIGGLAITGLVRQDSSTLQGTTAPHAAGPADLTAVNPDGQTDLLSSGFFYTDATHPCQNTAAAALALQRVVPGSGATTGGAVITLVGTGFVPGAAVKFGNTSAQDVRLLGSGALTCTLPAGTIGPTDVTVSLPDGRSTRLPASFDYFDATSSRPRPVLTGIAPNAGPNTGGTTALLTGQGFAPGARVFFGATEAALPTVIDASRLVAVTPASFSGPVDVTVINVDGKSALLSSGFAFYPVGAAGSPPLAQRVTPRTGSTLTPTAVVLSGSGFQPGAQVFVGGNPATSVSLNPDGSLAATFPAAASATVDVTVTNPDGQSSTIQQGFTYTPPIPSITTLLPPFGPLEGGTSVVIAGSGFLPGDSVVFDTTSAATKVLADTAIFATVPQHAAGVVNVSIQRAGAVVFTKVGSFEYRPVHPGLPPGIAALQPATGPASGGTVLWMTGANFVRPTKAAPQSTQVFFGGVAATRVIVADAGHAIVYAPPGAAGSTDVTAINPDGQSTAFLRGFAYVDDALLSGFAPVLTSATPTQGPESGTTLTALTGSNFVANELVFVGTALGSGVSLLSSSILTASFPPQVAGVVDLAVTNPDGRSSVLPGGFTYLPQPRIISVTSSSGPAIGPTAGGTKVLVGGSGFLQGATVSFNGVPATSVVFGSPNLITCVTPPGVAGLADIQVTNPDGQVAVLSGGWLYVPPPVASALLPAIGPPAGGTIAVLTGTGFASGATVKFGGAPASQVLFGSATTLIVTAPPGTGAVNVSVVNADGQSSTVPQPFTYTTPTLPPPALAASPIAPATGLDTGGTYATITGPAAGGNFQPGALAIVGALPMARVQQIDASTLTGVTGPGQQGAAMVAVTNPDGQSTFVPNAFLYSDHTKAAQPPLVTSLVPNTALAPGGSAVVVNGSGFQTGALVYLGGRPAPLNGTSTPTQLVVRSPAAPAGRADAIVTNPDGQTFISPLAFTFLVPPPVFAATAPVTPAAGPTAGGTAVRILGSYFLPPVQVYFGDAQVQTITSQSTTELDVIAPPGIAGAVGIRVVNSDGQFSTLPAAWAYQPPPVLLTVSPTSGPPEGNIPVYLKGRYFNLDATNLASVQFGNASVLAIATATATDLAVTIPSSTAAGSLTVAVTITNKDGQKVTVPGSFVYLPPAQPPVVNGVTPAASTLSGGLTVTVLGAHFQFGAAVYFGAYTAGMANPPPQCANVVVQSDGALTCVAPAAAQPGLVALTLVNPDGKASTLNGAFTYVAGPPPAQLGLQSLSPGAGDVSGGTRVIIAGQGFLQGATAVLVPANGNSANSIALTSVQVVGPTAITAVTPPQPGGSTASWDLYVSNPGTPPAILSRAFTYGTGIRHYRPIGLRMPMESNSQKYNRTTNAQRSTTAWQGAVGDFTQLNSAGVRDAIVTGYSGRNPRLLQGSVDPLGTNAPVFTDVTATNLHNADGSPVRDTCCGSSNANGFSYSAFEPRTLNLPKVSSWTNLAFWNDDWNALTIFWNSNGVLTGSTYNNYGNFPNTQTYSSAPYNWGVNDWVGGNDATGKMIDFNLDGYPDFAFAGEGANWLMLSCGTGLASPYCGSFSDLPSLLGAIPAGVQTATLNTYWQRPDQGPFIAGDTQLVIDAGANQEVVTVTGVSFNASNQANFTANFRFAHAAGAPISPVINTTSATAVPTVAAAGTVVTLTLADMSGLGYWYNQLFYLDAGTDQEEPIHANLAFSLANLDYAKKTLTVRVYKTHALPGGMTITTASPRNYVTDATRFTSNYGQAYSIAAGDLDGNGDTDLLTGHTQAGGSLHAWLNNATFLTTQNPDKSAYNFTFVDGTLSTFGTTLNGNVRAVSIFPTGASALPDILLGYDNCYQCGGGQQEILYLNQGGGKFADATKTAKLPTGCTQLSAIPQGISDAILRYDIADVDGNGFPDVLAWIDQTGQAGSTQRQLRLWLNDGHGCFLGAPNAQGALPVDNFFAGLGYSTRYILGDVNRDGLPDLLVPFDTIQSREYINQGGFLADKTLSNLPDSTPGKTTSVQWWPTSYGPSLTDVNGDGYPDLILSRTNHPLFSNGCFNYNSDPDGGLKLYLNDQKGNYSHDDTLLTLPTAQVGNARVSALPGTSTSVDAAAKGVGAVNNGVAYPGPDLLVGNSSYWTTFSTFPYAPGSPFYNSGRVGSVHLLLNQPDANGKPTGVFVDGSYPRLPTSAVGVYASVVKFIDLTNSGHPDIVVGRGDTSTIEIWQNSGNGFYQDVTSTALRGSAGSRLPDCGCGNMIKDIQIANLDENNLGLPGLVVATDCGVRLVMNRSDSVNHTIHLVDETDGFGVAGGAPRLPSSPSARSVVVGDFNCDGSPDLYVIQANGNERVLINTACLAGQPCGFFNDQTAAYLPQASPRDGYGGANCIGTDCAGNQQAIGISYDSLKTDVLIARYSNDGTVRPLRLLKNMCGPPFNEISQASWQPLPSENDKTYGILAADIFGHKDGHKDLLILNEWGPRIFENLP